MEQQLKICGEDRNNPVILFLHGGPAMSLGFLNYVWQPYLYDKYTIVSFEQRGCGQTYYANPKVEVSAELILQDVM